jgi:double-stranded uracil-DNA glycosylase
MNDTEHDAGLLPDLLQPGLSVIFCGINPGMRAALTGHHFAGRGNRFWRTLHLAGFTEELIAAENDDRLLACGYGLTTVVERPTQRASQLSKSEIVSSAESLGQKIAHWKPHYVAFLGKMAISVISSERNIAWGLQPFTLGGARAWVLPNPSGLNRSFSLDDLVAAYRELRVAAQNAG